jgi:predicted metal-dependent hydrolase
MTEQERNLSSRVESGPGEGVVFRRSARARRYRLTLDRDGMAVATIPARGSEREARRFVERHGAWLERARERLRRRPRVGKVWTAGSSILWRGEMTEIRIASEQPPAVCLAADVFRVPGLDGDLRAALERQFVKRARSELPARAWELSTETGAGLNNTTVRNQRSRWGSCSASGTVSLNWRLIQMPEQVRDYIILHELVHLRDEMNHSARFWAKVAEVCPWWRDAERWIKRNSGLLGM